MTHASPILKLLSLILIFSTASIAAAQNSATDPSGTWRWKYEMDGKTREDSVSLNLDSGRVTGTFRGQPEKPIDVQEAKLKDNQLSFTVEYKLKDQSVSLTFAGKIKQDDLEGTVTVTTEAGTDEYPWTPKRSVQLDDVIGQRISLSMPTGINSNHASSSRKRAKHCKESTPSPKERASTQLG